MSGHWLTLVLDLFHHNHPSMVEGRNILWYDYLTATPDNPWPYKVELLVITISYAFNFNNIGSRKIHTSKIRQCLHHKSVRVRLPLRLTDHWVLFDNSSSVNTTFCHKPNTLWGRDYHHHQTWGNWKKWAKHFTNINYRKYEHLPITMRFPQLLKFW